MLFSLTMIFSRFPSASHSKLVIFFLGELLKRKWRRRHHPKTWQGKRKPCVILSVVLPIYFPVYFLNEPISAPVRVRYGNSQEMIGGTFLYFM